MSKQDRQGVRFPADLERKYNFDKSFSNAEGAAHEANRNAAEAYQAVAELEEKTNQAITIVEAQAVYTAIMTGTLLERQLTENGMKEKIANWYTLGLWTEAMVNSAVEKGVLTEDEATEIFGQAVE